MKSKRKSNVINQNRTITKPSIDLACKRDLEFKRIPWVPLRDSNFLSCFPCLQSHYVLESARAKLSTRGKRQSTRPTVIFRGPPNV